MPMANLLSRARKQAVRSVYVEEGEETITVTALSFFGEWEDRP